MRYRTKKPAQPRNPDEIEDLKAQWLEDPCWDLELTEGFEVHRAELRIFSLEQKLKSAQETIAEYRAIFRGLKHALQDV